MTRRTKASSARAFLSAVCLLVLALATAGPVLGASVSFGTPTATSTFGKGVTFKQPYSGASGFKEVDIVITYPASLGPAVVKLESPGSGSFTYELDTSEGQLQPNTKLKARFQVIFADGSIQTGPEIAVTYSDTRFKWRTKTGSIVRLSWYSGSDSFASQALDIAQTGVAKAMEFMGAKESAPIDFFVYADQSAFYDALGPAVRENVGGLANTGTRTLFALIEPGDMSYARTVVPHELTHVIFDQITTNPYHYPPHWLNEGVATYVSQGYDSSDRGLVKSAAGNGTLMPLAALGGQFPTSQARFYLAYAESVAALDYLIKEHGSGSLDKLLAAFGSGASDDEAFVAATGADLAAFDAAWMSSVGAKPVASFGPRPAPTGPIPPGWTGPDGAVASPAASSTASASAQSSTESASGSDSNGSSGIGLPLLMALILGLGLGVAILAVLVARRGRLRSTDGS